CGKFPHHAAEKVPVEMEDRLPGAPADVDEDAVVVETSTPGGVRDEVEHALRLVGWKLCDLAKRVDVTLGEHEQVRLGGRVDGVDRDEPFGASDVVSIAG